MIDFGILVQHILNNHTFLKFGLVGLFLNGVFSSLVPIPTEFITSALIKGGDSKLVVALILMAGSIIGGMLAYQIGSKGNSAFHILYKTQKKGQQDRDHKLLAKYGWIIIFVCSWIPVLSYVIPITAGVKHYNFRNFVIAMSTGKALKIIAIVSLIGIIFK
jgi:membrane protein YqaA with SNARE-associated domain